VMPPRAFAVNLAAAATSSMNSATRIRV
jgi:hypothetical protein